MVLKIWLKVIPLHPLVATVSCCSGRSLGQGQGETSGCTRHSQGRGTSPWGLTSTLLGSEQSRQFPGPKLLEGGWGWGTQALAFEVLPGYTLPPWQVTSLPGS